MLEGNEVVGVAVDEEHRAVALLELLHGRSLPESPAVLHLGHKAGALKHIGRDESEALLSVVVELQHHRGVTAVLHEGANIFGKRVATGHHHRCAAHGNAVEHHEVVVEDVVCHRDPLLDVETVVPAHLDMVAFGIAVILKVREEDVVVKVVAVHAHQIQEHEVVVAVAVDHDCSSLCGSRILGRNVAGVNLEIVVAHDEGIPEDTLGLEAIVPCRAAGQKRVGFMTGAFYIVHTMRRGRKCEIGHEPARRTAAERRCGRKQDEKF